MKNVTTLPPSDNDVEEIVLGSIIIENGAFLEVADMLKPETFYKKEHQLIFKAAFNLTEECIPIDIPTIANYLLKSGDLEKVGGFFKITELTGRVVSAKNIIHHARILVEKHIQRQFLELGFKLQEKACDPTVSVDTLISSAEELFQKTQDTTTKADLQTAGQVLAESVRQIEASSKRKDGMSGVPSGFTELDAITSGWQPSDLIIIAARPSVGKTAFVLSMLRNMALDHGVSVGMFSLEMSKVQLMNRLITGETGLSSEKIKTGNLADYEWEQLDYKISGLVDAPIVFDDSAGLNIFEFRSKLKKMVDKHGVKLVVIDYLQLMSNTSLGSREQEVAKISRALKGAAKDYNIPIIALSQMNRKVEDQTGDKRPKMAHLRESGAIEQDADIITFIHRPERMGILEDENGNSTKGMAEIIIAKHRNGACEDVKLRFIAEQAKFVNCDSGTWSNPQNSVGFEEGVF